MTLAERAAHLINDIDTLAAAKDNSRWRERLATALVNAWPEVRSLIEELVAENGRWMETSWQTAANLVKAEDQRDAAVAAKERAEAMVQLLGEDLDNAHDQWHDDYFWVKHGHDITYQKWCEWEAQR